MFERIRLFYEKRLWTAAMVLQAADKGLLTEEQYRQIVGLPAGDTGGTAAEIPASAAQAAAGGEADRTEVSANG